MKKTLIVVIITAITFTYCGYLVGMSTVKPLVVYKERYNEDTFIPNKGTSMPFTVQFADSVGGRPTYNISFPDSTGLDSMYPEEIAASLITGKWQYNEDFRIDTTDYSIESKGNYLLKQHDSSLQHP